MDVDTIRMRLEAYRDGLELDRYELARGLRGESQERALREQHAELFLSDARSLLDSAIARADQRNEASDAASLRILRAGLTQYHVQHELAPIDAAIARHGRVVHVDLDDGTRRPLRDMKLMLAATAETDVRRQLEAARVEAAKELIPLMSEKIAIEQGIAQELGHPQLLSLAGSLYQVEIGHVVELAEAFLEQTHDLYHEVMGWTVRKRLGLALADAHRCDVPFVLAGRYLDYADAFTAHDMVARARDFLGRINVPLHAEGRLRTEVVPTDDGPPRAYAAPLRIPHDVRLVLELQDGQRDWLAFLDALGRGLFLSHVDPSAPVEQRALGDPSVDLAYGALFRNLLLDPEWLKRSLEFSRPKDYVILAYLERLYDLRLCCGRVIHDVELRRRASTEGAQEHFEDTMRRAIGVYTPPELYLHDVRAGLHSVTQLRARLFEPLLTLHLVHYFDTTWWANPRTGTFLTKEWWNGRRFRVEQLAHDMGHDLDIKPLLKLFLKNL